MEKIIVQFHIGRGGRFFNGGFKTYVGHGKTLQDYVANSNSLFEVNGDIVDESGNVILDKEDFSKEVGIISEDGEYDTTIFKYLGDIDEIELTLIIKAEDVFILTRIGLIRGFSELSIDLMRIYNRWDDLVDCIEPETYIEENYIYDEETDSYIEA